MKISVVIPFYNLERYVRECLDSVLAAAEKLNTIVDLDLDPRPSLEVICVDDGSTDGTGALLDGYAAEVEKRGGGGQRTVSFEDDAERIPRLRVIHQPNGGEGSARNAGMAAATGEWVTFLDGDDVWLANHLTLSAPAITRHPEADLVSFAFVPFEDGTEPPRPAGDEAEERVVDVRSEIPSSVLLDVGVYPTFYRREFLKGATFSKLPLGADRLFVAQCLARAKSVVRSETVIHGYRLRANSMAHCAWSAKKVMSQCDYSFGSLQALTASGKNLGREGHAYLASLWLSDVPNRIARLRGEDCRSVWEKWSMTLSERVCVGLPRYDLARRLLRSCRRSMTLSLFVARLLRKGGMV